MKAHEKITAVYCRVAHADPLALDNQREMLIHYAQRNGYGNVRYYADNGYNGLNYDRPDFSQMEAAIQDGLVAVVLVRDVSRIGRSFDAAIWVEQLRGKRIALVEANMPLRDNVLGNLACFQADGLY